MKKRPKNLDNKYGWCSKDDHGVIIFPKEGVISVRKRRSVRKTDFVALVYNKERRESPVALA